MRMNPLVALLAVTAAAMSTSSAKRLTAPEVAATGLLIVSTLAEAT